MDEFAECNHNQQTALVCAQPFNCCLDSCDMIASAFDLLEFYAGFAEINVNHLRITGESKHTFIFKCQPMFYV